MFCRNKCTKLTLHLPQLEAVLLESSRSTPLKLLSHQSHRYACSFEIPPTYPIRTFFSLLKIVLPKFIFPNSSFQIALFKSLLPKTSFRSPLPKSPKTSSPFPLPSVGPRSPRHATTPYLDQASKDRSRRPVGGNLPKIFCGKSKKFQKLQGPCPQRSRLEDSGKKPFPLIRHQKASGAKTLISISPDSQKRQLQPQGKRLPHHKPRDCDRFHLLSTKSPNSKQPVSQTRPRQLPHYQALAEKPCHFSSGASSDKPG